MDKATNRQVLDEIELLAVVKPLLVVVEPLLVVV